MCQFRSHFHNGATEHEKHATFCWFCLCKPTKKRENDNNWALLGGKWNEQVWESCFSVLLSAHVERVFVAMRLSKEKGGKFKLHYDMIFAFAFSWRRKPTVPAWVGWCFIALDDNNRGARGFNPIPKTICRQNSLIFLAWRQGRRNEGVPAQPMMLMSARVAGRLLLASAQPFLPTASAVQCGVVSGSQCVCVCVCFCCLSLFVFSTSAPSFFFLPSCRFQRSEGSAQKLIRSITKSIYY